MDSNDLDSYFDERPIDNCVYDLIEALMLAEPEDDMKERFEKIKSDLETSNTSFAKKKRHQIRDIPRVWDDYRDSLTNHRSSRYGMITVKK